MLGIVSEGFKKAAAKFSGKVTLTEENVGAALQEIRASLLEADVEYSVVMGFLERVKNKTLGTTVQLRAGQGTNKMRVNPTDHFVKSCQEELENLMGPVDTELTFPKNRPTVIMMVGLQGTGKTTTTGKLASYLKNHKKRAPMLVAADIYRAAAVEQLKVVGEKVGVPVFHIPNEHPVEICRAAVKKAYELDCDTILLDTAGRLTIDDTLMAELEDIKRVCRPDHVLLVCDAMMGQDAVTTAKAFDSRLDISGFILTKLDGDSRGGAALSIKEVTGKPIKFLGTGEHLDRLEEFRPKGLASRILGQGDVVGLMKDFERVNTDDRQEDAMRMLQGQFTLKDFYEQISMIQKMGSLKDLMAKMPLGNMLPPGAELKEGELTKIKAIIDSMTAKERVQPDIVNASRIHRVARGSGRSPKEVQELLTKFKAMRSMMGNLGRGMMGKLPGMGGLNRMRNMMKAGAGGMPNLEQMMGGGEMSKPTVFQPRVSREKLKKARRAAKDSRKKNRKR